MQNNFTLQENQVLIIKQVDDVLYRLEALNKQDIKQKLNSIKKIALKIESEDEEKQVSN